MRPYPEAQPHTMINIFHQDGRIEHRPGGRYITIHSFYEPASLYNDGSRPLAKDDYVQQIQVRAEQFFMQRRAFERLSASEEIIHWELPTNPAERPPKSGDEIVGFNAAFVFMNKAQDIFIRCQALQAEQIETLKSNNETLRENLVDQARKYKDLDKNFKFCLGHAKRRIKLYKWSNIVMTIVNVALSIAIAMILFEVTPWR